MKRRAASSRQSSKASNPITHASGATVETLEQRVMLSISVTPQDLTMFNPTYDSGPPITVTFDGPMVSYDGSDPAIKHDALILTDLISGHGGMPASVSAEASIDGLSSTSYEVDN